MKIAPVPLPEVPHAPSVVVRPEPKQSFEDMLAGLPAGFGAVSGALMGDAAVEGYVDGPTVVAQRRAFGFAELGLFGMKGAQDGVAQTSDGDPRFAQDTAETIGSTVAETPEAVVEPTAAPGARATGGEARPPIVENAWGRTLSLSTSEDHGRIGAGNTAPADDDARSIAPDGCPDEPDFGADAGRPVPERRRPVSPSGRLSVLVAETGEGVEVVAAAPALTPEARARLRKLASELVAEFGLTLAEVSLNGSLLDTFTPNRIGAPHGDQSR